ncbi:deoxyribonuclease-1-like isoform X2 [Osmerus mordax]|uniref:deoxyribonuclease-1-like isoform X2 n=1 Tax=Osmerus mordax TaxID=8014 RepID=UPI00350FD2B2
MKVAAFNIQKFGTNKVSDPQILPILIKIVSRYDIIVILEVVDAKGKSVKTFLQELNKANKEHRYTMEISTRLGRTRYKEQYLFLYRDDVVDLIGTYQFADKQAGQEDAFAREPYVLRFKCHNTVMNDLVLMPVHTKPVEAEKELDELYDVFLDVKRKWGTDNIMILGDFNADGSYVSKKEMKLIRIRSDKNFHWLISDDVDTTANHKNDHTYDRIVVYGDDMLAAVVPNSAKPFNFQQEYGLTNAQTLDVSDHYPVEVELKKSKKSKRQQEDKLGQENWKGPSSTGLALSSNQGHRLMEGVEGGFSSDPGGSSSDTQAYGQGMFQVIYVTVFIQQLFMNIVGVKCIAVPMTGNTVVLLPPPTVIPLCHTEVTVKLIVIRQYVCHMRLLNIDQIGHLLSQVEVVDDQETVSACSESALGEEELLPLPEPWASTSRPRQRHEVGADNVRALYKKNLELDIEYKRLLIEKTRLEIEKLEYEKKERENT